MQAETSNLFRNPFRWLVFGNRSKLTNYFFSLDSQVYFIKEEATDLYKLETIYKLPNQTKEINHTLAIWSSKRKNFEGFQEYSVFKNRSDLQGTTIKISYVVTNVDSLNHIWDYRYLKRYFYKKNKEYTL